MPGYEEPVGGECPNYIYHPNGKTLKSGSYFYHANGKTFKSGSYLYHVEGKTLKSGSYFYHSNVKTAKSGDYLYDEDGRSLPSDKSAVTIELEDNAGTVRVSKKGWSIIYLDGVSTEFILSEDGELSCR